MSVHYFKHQFHKLHSQLRNLTYKLTQQQEAVKVHQEETEASIITLDLTGMVEDLDIALRIPYEMYYVGHPCKDIARILKLPLGDVKNSISFAQKELKEKIERRRLGARA
jgi:DNA-directed RNA polymerase specialized sigma24 family protein